MKKTPEIDVADKLASEVLNLGKSKRVKVRTLLSQFGYEKRTEDNATRITELLSQRNILLNPSIMKLGDTWQLSLDDRVYLLERAQEMREVPDTSNKIDIYDFMSDKWFDDILSKKFRTEREVETKFIIPLLTRLGFNDDDRYDGMIVNAAHGSRPTRLEVDFVLFDSGNENLNAQVLLVAEAKKEDRLYKKVELDKAQKQVKSYAIWLSCHFGLVTDGRVIQVLDLFPSINGMKVIFECSREELRANFSALYKLISKTRLSEYHERLMR